MLNSIELEVLDDALDDWLAKFSAYKTDRAITLQ